MSLFTHTFAVELIARVDAAGRAQTRRAAIEAARIIVTAAVPKLWGPRTRMCTT